MLFDDTNNILGDQGAADRDDRMFEEKVYYEIEKSSRTFTVACVASVFVRFRSKEKELGGGGEERKETLADKPRDSENRPLGLSCVSSRTDI